MVHVLQMFRHSIIFVITSRRKTIVWYWFYSLPMLHNHILNYVVRFAVRFAVLVPICLFFIWAVRTWSRSLATCIDWLRFIIKSVVLASEAGCTANVINFNKNYIIAFVIGLVGRFNNGNRYIVLPHSWNTFSHLFFL